MSDSMRDKLIAEIKNVFDSTIYPGDDHLGRKDIAEAFRGKSWTEIPLETIISFRDSMSSFTPEAFRYYFPAFLLATLFFPEEVDTLVDNVIYDLNPSKEDEYWSKVYFPKVVEGLTLEQRLAIREFLESYEDLFPYQTWRIYEEKESEFIKVQTYWRQLSS